MHADKSDLPERFLSELAQLKDQGRFRELNCAAKAEAAEQISSKVILKGEPLVNFASNDYLGFASTIDASGSRISGEYAFGSGASALVSGWTTSHERLVGEIKQLEGTEAAVVFPSGYAACSGVISALAGPDDLILSDQLNHASLIDGCRLSKAKTRVFAHRETAHLERLLKDSRSSFETVWIVTDTVFSMDGTIASLEAMSELAKQYDAWLVVDEAHATGVFGSGAGMLAELGVEARVAMKIGTLSKAIGCQGGFAAGPQLLIDYLVNRCRSLIYSTSLSPVVAEQAADRIQWVQEDEGRSRRVRALASRFRRAIGAGKALSLADRLQVENEVPIIPVICGDGSDRAAIEASSKLRREGFWVPAIRPPTVPERTSRLRVSLTAA
ncbi:MAG: 8-amino-7-oxononanoate synthase, partial [Planctomycetota bacterium]